MSEKNMEKLVKEFLKQVKEKLPEWLKDNKKELRGILDELREHIWAKAEELSGIGQPTEDSIRMAIAHMGTPQSIAKEYKRRGTPKIYITEELWPLYKKWLIAVITIIIILNIFSFIMEIILGDWNWSIDLDIFINILLAFVIITVIFVALSMEGYLPEDFKSKKEIQKEKRELEIAKEKGLPISPKTGKPFKPIVKPVEKIVGGVIAIVFGIILITLPFPGIENLINTAFLLIIRVMGVYIIVDGGIDVIRGILGDQVIIGQQITLVLKAGLAIAWIPLLIIILNSPEIIPIISYNGNSNIWYSIQIPIEYHEAFRNIIAVIIAITVISAIYNVYKAGTLEKYKIKY